MTSAGRGLSPAVRMAMATGLSGIAVITVVAGTGVPSAATNVPPDPSTDGPGLATTPTLTLDPPVVDFGETRLGTESDTEVVTLTVSGGTVEDLSVRAEGPFVVDHDCGALADGQTCSIEIRFVPTEEGSAGGQLVVESSTASNTAALEGTATPPFITVPIITGPPTTVQSQTTIPPISVAPTNVPPTNAPNTAVPPSSIPPTSAPVETREECDARALGARITYAPSLEMRVGESESIAASASIGDGATDSSVAGPSTVVVPQALQCQVRARLLGGEDFTTNPEDWQEASFLGTTDVSWRWVVTPKVVGEGLFLILEVQGLRFDAEAGAYVPAGNPFNEEARIRVDSRPRGVVSRLNDAVSGVVTHPLVAFAGAGGLVVLFRWGLQRRRKDAADNPDDRPPT
jgi:hypothetical protein